MSVTKKSTTVHAGPCPHFHLPSYCNTTPCIQAQANIHQEVRYLSRNLCLLLQSNNTQPYPARHHAPPPLSKFQHQPCQAEDAIHDQARQPNSTSNNRITVPAKRFLRDSVRGARQLQLPHAVTVHRQPQQPHQHTVHSPHELKCHRARGLPHHLSRVQQAR